MNRITQVFVIGMVVAGISNGLAADRAARDAARPNVLMIIIDDMNDWVSHLASCNSGQIGLPLLRFGSY